jgi:hypothetical protein
MFLTPRLGMAREKLLLLMQCFADKTGGQPLTIGISNVRWQREALLTIARSGGSLGVRTSVFYVGFLIGIVHVDEQRKWARAGQQFADDFEPFWDQRRAHDRHARHIAIVYVA